MTLEFAINMFWCSVCCYRSIVNFKLRLLYLCLPSRHLLNAHHNMLSMVNSAWLTKRFISAYALKILLTLPIGSRRI
jgi:hypothetical protein